MKQKQKSSPARAAMKLLCAVLGLVLAAMLGVTVYVQHLLGQINYVDPDASAGLSREALEQYLGVSSSDPGGAQSDSNNTLIGGPGSHIVNILLIGQDRREGEGRARSDSMILCTFNKRTKQLIMTSFLRDLYVEIPGYSSNRINAAYAVGGMSLLDRTLERNFGLYIDGNVEVDFNQFSEIVDLLGGVEIELRQDEADFINEETDSALSQGVHILSGDQALAYARIRKLDADGDFSRSNRQRKVISALLDAYKGSGLTAAMSLVSKLLPMITTDMSSVEIMGHAMNLFPMLSGAELVSQRVPADGAYSAQTIDAMAVLVPDLDATREILERTLLGN